MKQKSLKQRFEEVANDYLLEFITKQDLDCDGWVGDDIGGICSFIQQYFFNLDDIRQDIDKKAPKGLILSWQDDNLEAGRENSINYHSYIMGLRHKDLTCKK